MQGTFALSRQVTRHAVAGRHGVVACQSRMAAEAGAAVLVRGGNAIDAAIATSLALTVIEPWMSGLGGIGCMLARFEADGRLEAIDFGPIAPLKLDPTSYPLREGKGGDLFAWQGVEGDHNLEGPLSWCVPTYLQGLGLAHERYGSLPWAELAAPAAEFAAGGLEIDWYAALLIAAASPALLRHPLTAERYLIEGCAPFPTWTGDSVWLPRDALAATMRIVRDEGWRTILSGTLKRRFMADVAKAGGVLVEEDFEAAMPRVVTPLRFAYRDAEIAAMPGLFGGVTLQAAMARLSAQTIGGDVPDAEAYAAYAAALEAATRERMEHLGDAGNPADPGCTSHVSVIDDEGNTVSLTQTLLSSFGAKTELAETGILMNNGVMWFDPVPGRPNSLAPAKRPLANMCPVLARSPGYDVALGASGGRRIVPAVMQILSFLTDHFMPLEEALNQPRLDVAGDGLVTLDARIGKEAAALLGPLHRLRLLRPVTYPLLFGCASAVLNDRADEWRYGMVEPLHPWADAAAEVWPKD